MNTQQKLMAINSGYPLVVVNSTFVKQWEVDKYKRPAKNLGVKVEAMSDGVHEAAIDDKKYEAVKVPTLADLLSPDCVVIRDGLVSVVSIYNEKDQTVFLWPKRAKHRRPEDDVVYSYIDCHAARLAPLSEVLGGLPYTVLRKKPT